jgi:hypothetical protein
LERAVVSDATLSVATARVLRQALAGRIDARWIANASNAQGVALAHLMRLGWVKQEGEHVVLADEVSFGLEAPSASSVAQARAS